MSMDGAAPKSVSSAYDKVQDTAVETRVGVTSSTRYNHSMILSSRFRVLANSSL